MQHQEPECHAGEKIQFFFAVFKVEVQRGLIMIKILLFLLYLLNC